MNTVSQNLKTSSPLLLSASNTPSYAEAMIRTVNISEAKANLSKLAEDVSLGEEIIVSRSGEPLMKLVALTPDEKQAAQAKKLLRDLWLTAKYFEGFDWEEWDRLDEEVQDIWRKFGYMD
jgi:prevent-host-death family protein